MNRKFEEKLARLAFGDTTPEEAARIEAQAQNDAHAARTLAEFREMRAGLRDMAEVPEHQLSNERLRDAILARGLHPEPVKQKSSGVGAGWLWMPAAALALGFGIITLRPKAAVEPTVVLQGSGSTVARDFHFEMEDPGAFFRHTPTITQPQVASVKATTSDANSSPAQSLVALRRPNREDRRPRRTRHHNPSFTNATLIKVGPWKPNDLQANVNDSARFNPGGSVPRDAVASRTPAESTPIVLIDSNPDAATGAPTATEVGTASNVLIGG